MQTRLYQRIAQKLRHTFYCVIFCVKNGRGMATNLALDDDLITEAQKIGHHKTKKEAVMVALKEYIAHKKQQKIIELFGTVDFDESFDYKKSRKR